LHAGDGLPDRAHFPGARVVRGGDGRGLGEPVALVDEDAERVDELRHLERERGAAAERELQAPAEALPHLLEDRALEALLEKIDHAARLTRVRERLLLLDVAEGRIEEAALEAALLGHRPEDGVAEARE